VRLSRRDVALAGAAAALCGPAQARESGRFRAALARAVDRRGALFQDLTLSAPDGRAVPVRVAYPRRPRGALGFIPFSHGANSSGLLYDGVIGPLASAGYVVAAPTHPDSETNPNRAKFDQAAVQLARLTDMRMLIDQIQGLEEAIPAIRGEVDRTRIAAAGHSYGALIAQQLSGAAVRRPGSPDNLDFSDPRVRATLAISPPGPVPGFLDAAIWDGLKTPLMVTTGTKDTLPNFRTDWRAVLASFEKGPVGESYAVVAPGVDHYFGGAIGRLTVPGPKQLTQLNLTNAAAILFLDASLKGDGDARRTLKTFGAREYRDLGGVFEIRSR
jgi:dienelactone hydrolase